MKHFFTFVLALTLMIGNVLGQTTTKTVGGSVTDYATLQLAFAAINSGAIKGQIILQITGSTTETASAVLNASGTGSANYTTLLIYPKTSAFSISTAGNWATIDLNGADNVTIDGRIDQTGTPNSLSITGTNTGSGAAAIRFLNSAENNTVRYCSLSASSTSPSMGIVIFSSSASGNGNDNNSIEYCKLTSSAGGRPYNAILSSGTSGHDNSGDIIRNNSIYNIFSTTLSSNGININSASIGFTISGNSVYETTDFIVTGNALSYNAILISATAEHTISGNYIGGRQALCGGATWSFTAQRAVYFCAIYASAGVGTATTISNNTISNIDFSSKEDNPWDGIFLYTGNFEVSGNTIGATTGINSIISRTPVPVATTTISGGIVNAYAILNGGSGYTTAPLVTFSNPAGSTVPVATATIDGNGVVTALNFSSYGSGYTSAPSVIFDGQSNNYSTSHGMIQNSTGTVNISGNNIGSITTVGSDYYSHGFESIYVRGVSGITSLTNNLIGSLTTANSIYVSSAAASSLIKQDVYGLYSAGTGTTTISGNTVAHLTNAYAGTNSQSRTRGIQTIAGANTVTNNTVRDLISYSNQTSAGTSASAIGISQTSATAGTSQTVNGNTVYGLSNLSAAAKVQLFGMYYAGPSLGANSVSGNFVHSLSVSSSDIGAVINGIVINSGDVTCANNIINLGGSSLGYLINGIWDGTTVGNNVNFYFNTAYIGGSVSTGTTSATSALWNANNTSTRDYRNNILDNARTGGSGGIHYSIRVAGTSGLTIGYNDYRGTLSGITLNTAPDSHSLAIDPGFTSAGGTNAINYYASATLPGVSSTGINTDYYGVTRGSPPKMGAIEQNGNVWQGGISSDFANTANWTTGAIPSSGDDIVFASSPANDCVLDGNRTVGNISNGSSKNLVVNGKTLTINKSLNFTSSGRIATSVASSVVGFAGSTAQVIQSAAFTSNSVAALTINNSYGVTLNGNFAVSQSLALTSGAFAIGANTLTISGSTLTRTSGSIDASNASATLDFANASQIALPASVFSTDIENLTISGTGGITAGSDITVNGVLNLAAANPSAYKGLLEMTISYANYPGTTNSQYLSSYKLNMGAVATTIGLGDVTGTVKRTMTFVANTSYTFGHQYTTVALSTGTMPDALSVTITIGTTPAGNPGAIKRTYEIVPTVPSGYTSTSHVAANFHYLDSELTSSIVPYHTNSESTMVTMDYDIGGGFGTPDEHGRSAYDFTNNYLGLSNIPIDYFITINGTHTWRTLFQLRDFINGYYTWDGSSSSDWGSPGNWTPSGNPSEVSHVIIPDSATTPNDPILPADITINTLSIENGGVLVMGGNTLTIKNSLSGGWEDQNPLGNDPGTSKVIFSMPGTTISGNARFYNVEIGTGADITNASNSTMKIANTITKTGTGKWFADVYGATIEYNGGDQSVIVPDGTPQYHNLTLSGSGTKTMPGTALSLHGSLTLAGTTSATAASALTIGGNLVSESGTTFNAGAFSHAITGDIFCDGTITNPSGGTLTCTGNFNNTNSYTGASGSTLNCNGNFINTTSNAFSSTGSTLTFGGLFTNQGPFVGTSSTITCNGTFTNDNTFNGSNSTIYFKGHFINNGTFTSTGSTVTLNGTTSQTIGGTTSPSAFNIVTISNTSGVTLLNNTTTAALNIASGALTLSAGKSLTASGTTTLNSAQCLVLKSDATGTASFKDNGTITITNGGTALIERYLTPYDIVADLKFHFISSPVVAGSQLIETEFLDFSGSAVTDFYKWNEAGNEWTNYRGASYTEKNVDFGDSFKFVPGKGYMVAYPLAVTKNFVGVPYTGNLTVDCTHGSGGWNLIGNPYPSSVDWTTGITKTGLDAALYYYDNATPGYIYYSDFSGGLGGASKYIAPMQGFMVHSTSAGSVVISNTARTHLGQDVFYKSAELVTNILELKVEGSNKTDYARVCFYNQASNNFDGEYDAYKLFSYSASATELYSVAADNTSLAINTLPETVMDGGTVPVSFKTGATGNFTITADKLSTFANTSITLEDKTTATFQKLNDNPAYTFFATANDVADRFVLHFKNATSIPEPKTDYSFEVSYIKGVVKVETDLIGVNGDIRVTDMVGRTLAVSKYTSGTAATFSLNVKPGVYIVGLYTANRIYSQKVLVY